MKIKVICFFYNESALIPFFLRHYKQWADSLHAVVSKGTDNTRELLVRTPAIDVEDWEMPGGRMDDFAKLNKLNSIVIARHDADWLVVVDADEFIWPANKPQANGDYVRAFLGSVAASETAVMAGMWNVFRHVMDSDLDSSQAPALQRRYGILHQGIGENAPYHKPCVIRANRGLEYGLGQHYLKAYEGVRFAANQHFDGAHWQNADPVFAISRRCRDRRDRMSAVNTKNGLGCQHYGVTEAGMVEFLKSHENDPQCF